MKDSSRHQIKNLLLVLFLGLGLGLFFVGMLLFFYNPTGQYLIKDTLLSPELLPGLVFNSSNSKTSGSSRFMFHGIDFLYFDNESKQWKKTSVSIERYKRFYEMLKTEKSIEPVTPEMEKLFIQDLPAKLNLLMTTESDAAWQKTTQPLQQVEFSKDYYRVLLRESNAGSHWAYFFHPGISGEVVQLFGHAND